MKAAGLALILTLPWMTGCVLGTAGTRVANEGDVAGRFPFQAVGSDVETVFSAPHPHVDLRPLAVISIPLDLVMDVVLLPFDLILWPFGFSK